MHCSRHWFTLFHLSVCAFIHSLNSHILGESSAGHIPGAQDAMIQLMSFLSLESFFSWRQQGSDRLLYHRLCMLVASCHLKFLLVCLYQSCLHPRNRILTRERLFGYQCLERSLGWRRSCLNVVEKEIRGSILQWILCCACRKQLTQ